MQSPRTSRLAVFLSIFWVGSVSAETIAIIGTGDVASALGPEFASQGHTIPMERKRLSFRHAVETSNAQIIKALQPNAEVVKAFNTLNWKTMIDPESAGGPVSIPLASDSPRAKKSVATLVKGMGLEPIDVGGVENATGSKAC